MNHLFYYYKQLYYFFLSSQTNPPKLVFEKVEPETLKEHTPRSQTNTIRPRVVALLAYILLESPRLHG